MEETVGKETAAYEQYKHHGQNVWVRKDLRGRHREHCLCHSCKKLDMENRENTCPIAELLYRFCVLTGCTTPVFECPKFDPKG